MDQNLFPVIDPAATGRNIQRLRKANGLSVRDLQSYFGFEDPQAIYRWQWGRSLPSVDNLYALSILLHVSMNEILVPQPSIPNIKEKTADMAVFSVLVNQVAQNIVQGFSFHDLFEVIVVILKDQFIRADDIKAPCPTCRRITKCNF